MDSNKKTIFGWLAYTWANSPYSLAIITAIFPSYYSQVSKEAAVRIENNISIVNFLGFETSSVSLFSYAVSLSYLVITLTSPLIGAISDYTGNKKIFMWLFSTLGSLACLLLYFFDKSNYNLGVFAFSLGAICFSFCHIFTDSLLPEITTPENYSKLSAKGFIAGYMGSVLHLIISLTLIINYQFFGFQNEIAPVKRSFILVGIWWFGFSQITFFTYKNNLKEVSKFDSVIKNSFENLYNAYIEVKKTDIIKWFLVSYFFYNMGVQTSIYMSSLFATEEVHLKSSELIITILLIQFVAILGTYVLTKISKNRSYSKILIFSTLFWIGLCFYAYFVKTSFQFYLLSVGVGLIMGSVQSLSRGVFSTLISDKNEKATFFSFYSIVDKASIIIALFIYGLVNQLTHSMRTSIFCIIFFFILAFFTTLKFKKSTAKSNLLNL